MKSIDEYFDALESRIFRKEETPQGFIYHLDPSLGIGQEIMIGDIANCYAVFVDLTLFKDLVTSEAVNERYMIVALSISGELMYYTKRDDPDYTDPGLNIYLNYPLATGYSRVEANSRNTSYSLFLRESFFNELPFDIPEDFWERGAKMLNDGALDLPEIIRLMEEMREQVLPLTGLSAKLCVYSKAIEVLALLINIIYDEDVYVYPSLSFEDRKMLEKARELLAANLKKPPAIKDLARTLGVSHQKLLKGFKQASGTTVHGYLVNLRMQEAARLLRESDMKVAMIAREVGYHGDGHFQQVFAEAFDMTPDKYRKSFSAPRLKGSSDDPDV